MALASAKSYAIATAGPVSPSPTTFSAPFTIESYVFLTNGSSVNTIYTAGTVEIDKFKCLISASKLRLRVPNSIIYSSTITIPLNTWVHVAVSGTPDGIYRFYLNGTLQTTLTTGVSFRNVTTSAHRWFDTFEGRLSEMRYWSVVRTSAQIQDNYNKSILDEPDMIMNIFSLRIERSLTINANVVDAGFGYTLIDMNGQIIDTALNLVLNPITWVQDASNNYLITSMRHYSVFMVNGAGITVTNAPTSYITTNYKQMIDIDLLDIYTLSKPDFRGVYDGNLYKIKNRTNAPSNVTSNSSVLAPPALFAVCTDATIKNLRLTGIWKSYTVESAAFLCSLSTRTSFSNIHMELKNTSLMYRNGTPSGTIFSYGCLCAKVFGPCIIENIRVKGFLTYNSGLGNSTSSVGGIIGGIASTDNVIVRDCIFSPDTRPNGMFCGPSSGGIIGDIQSTNSSFIGLINDMTGSISCIAPSNGLAAAGGIVGLISEINTVQLCMNRMFAGGVNSQGVDVHGIVGRMTKAGTITKTINAMFGGGSINGNSTGGSTTGVGGIGSVADGGIISKNLTAMSSNTLAPITNKTTGTKTNNVYSNRFGMLVNGSTLTVSNAQNGTLVNLNSFPVELTDPDFTGFDTTTFLPIWTYNYVDQQGVSRSIRSNDTSLPILEGNPFAFTGGVTTPTSNGMNNGSISAVLVTGGVPPYTYSYTSNVGPVSASTTVTAKTGLSNGTYNLTVTDSLAQTATFTFIIYSTLVVASTIIGEDAITLTVSGGNGTYSYTWTKNGVFFSNSKNLSGLLPAIYIVTITSATLTTTLTTNLPFPPVFSLTPTSVESSFTDTMFQLYKIDFKDSVSDFKVIFESTSQKRFFISGLIPATTYTFRVRGINSNSGAMTTLFQVMKTLPTNTIANFSRASLLTGTKILLNKITGVTPTSKSDILKSIALTNDAVVVKNGLQIIETVFKKTTDIVTIPKKGINENTIVPFDTSSAIAAQSITLQLSDGSTMILSYNATLKQVIVGGTTYSINDRISIDGRVLTFSVV